MTWSFSGLQGKDLKRAEVGGLLWDGEEGWRGAQTDLHGIRRSHSNFCSVLIWSWKESK
jgi:hypothetical protein